MDTDAAFHYVDCLTALMLRSVSAARIEAASFKKRLKPFFVLRFKSFFKDIADSRKGRPRNSDWLIVNVNSKKKSGLFFRIINHKSLIAIYLLVLINSFFLLSTRICSQNIIIDAENHYQLGLKLFQENKIEQALDEFTYSISKNPNHINARFNKSMIHIRKLQFNQAILDLEELRRLSPTYDKVNYFLGFSKYKIEASDSALSDLKKEIKTHPQYFEPYYLIGRIYLITQQIDSAIYYLNKSVYLNQKYYASYHELGVAYFMKNSLDTATSFFKEAINVKPTAVMSNRNLAMVYYYKGNLDMATEKLMKAYQLDSSNIFTLMNLGMVLYETQNYIEAKNMFSRSIESDPNHLPAYINRSTIYIEMGKYDEAIADLDYYILNDDKNGLAFLNRGIANENTFRWKEACKDWKKALELGIAKAQKYVEEECKE